MPESRHPSSCHCKEDGTWVVKGAFSNNGDEVFVSSVTDARTFARFSRLLDTNPNDWVLQRKFETVSVASDAGPLYPCVGVYTINGQAAGVYARASTGPITDYSALDVALLIAEDEIAEQR